MILEVSTIVSQGPRRKEMSITEQTQRRASRPAPGRRTPSIRASRSRCRTRVATFSGEVTDFDATLVDGTLTGAARIASSRSRTRTCRPTCSRPSSSTPSGTPRSRFSRASSARRRRRHVRGRDHDQGRHAARDPHRHDHRPGRRPVRQRALRPRARDDDRPHRVRDQLEQPTAERQPALADEVTLKADLSLVKAA